MTQNLRLVNYTLSPADSDVDGSFTLPQSNIDVFKVSGNNGNNCGADYNYCYLDPESGGFYTWLAATAGKGTMEKNQIKGYQVPSSICPKGWGLPSKSDADALVLIYDWTTAQQSPASFTLSGWLLTDSVGRKGEIGWWHTKTGSGGGNTTDFYLENSNFVVGTHTPQGSGQSVRCIGH